MQKAIIVGCSGSGKSTLSRKIHTLTGLPLYHLDNIFWQIYYFKCIINNKSPITIFRDEFVTS